MLYRLKAAWSAFRDPALVGEARGMRQTLVDLHPGSNEFALLYAEAMHGRVFPLVKAVPYSHRERIRNMLLYP